MIGFLFKFVVFVLVAYLIGVASAIYVNYNLKFKKHMKGVPWKECFSVFKMASVLIGFLLSKTLPLYIIDQYVMRFSDEQCRQCMEEGVCKFTNKPCGCDPLMMAYSPLEKCPAGNYGKIKGRKAFKEYLKEFYYKLKTPEYGGIE